MDSSLVTLRAGMEKTQQHKPNNSVSIFNLQQEMLPVPAPGSLMLASSDVPKLDCEATNPKTQTVVLLAIAASLCASQGNRLCASSHGNRTFLFLKQLKCDNYVCRTVASSFSLSGPFLSRAGRGLLEVSAW